MIRCEFLGCLFNSSPVDGVHGILFNGVFKILVNPDRKTYKTISLSTFLFESFWTTFILGIFYHWKKKEPPGNSAIKRPFWDAKKTWPELKWLLGTDLQQKQVGSRLGHQLVVYTWDVWSSCLVPKTTHVFWNTPHFFLKMVLIYRKSSNWNVAIRVFVEFFWIYWVGICYQP